MQDKLSWRVLFDDAFKSVVIYKEELLDVLKILGITACGVIIVILIYNIIKYQIGRRQ